MAGLQNSSCAKRAWDRALYSWNMVNLFLFGCHVTERTFASTDCTGRVGETIKKGGRGISGASWQIHIFYTGAPLLGLAKSIYYCFVKDNIQAGYSIEGNCKFIKST